jgi:beta-lactamase regulating signal transducer with metallopeptidase domain
LYFIASLVPLLSISYIYAGVYNLRFEDFYIYYGPVIFISAILLTLAIHSFDVSNHSNLLNQRKLTAASVQHKKLGLTREDADSIQASITNTESLAWAFFIINSIFIFTYLFLAFYVLKSLELQYNFAVSVLGAAVIAWQLARAMSK